MADNTEHFHFIHTFQGNLDALLPDFVAGDHLWYPVQGRPDIRVAPDVYVAMGRPKGHRGSYKQWEEEGVPLQVVFEWWSPRNDFAHQVEKLRFYDRYGVDELYTFDQLRRVFNAFHRVDGQLDPVATEGGVQSPLLGIRLALEDEELKGWRPDGRPFLRMTEMEANARLAEEKLRLSEARAEALAARLRALGVDPSE